MSRLTALFVPEHVPFLGKLLGFGGFALVLAMPMGDVPGSAQRLLAVTLLMAILWLTQAIPIAVTSLIPLAAFPLLGIQTSDVVSKSYINKSIFLYLGGFMIAMGIEKWGLHRRMALHIIRVLGTSLKRVILGFMLATAFLSMWISNTASTLLMLPIGLALVSSLREIGVTESSGENESLSKTNESVLTHFGTVLLIGIAYSASIGGFTTLVGTPTNVTFVQIWNDTFPNEPEISVGDWMINMIPLGGLLLLCAWALLVWKLPSQLAGKQIERSFFTKRLRSLGKMSQAERLMFLVFVTTAFLWIFREPLTFGKTPLVIGWGASVERFLLSLGADAKLAESAVHDSTVAMLMAILMFFLPARKKPDDTTEYLMDWETAEKLPWGILLLIGGGFALAGAFQSTGLSRWVGEELARQITDWPTWATIGAVCFLMTFLTEFTSNVATVSTVMPILAGTSIALGIDPKLIMVPATVSASCAFMLPIATPPNAIVFGSGKIQMSQMISYGIWLNLAGVILITLASLILGTP